MAELAESPWKSSPGLPWAYHPNFNHLVRLFEAPQHEAKIASSGNWASALDLWIADELRAAGFPTDEVWPRRTAPAVLPREVALLLANAPPPLRADLEKLIARTPAVASRDARVLGKAYVKQVDVVMAQWSRGPELMVSTKTMMSSFRKNLPNRFEEAYGDAANLRGRYPLASIGFFFLMRASVLNEAGTLQRAIDMLRKLRDPATYDATGLLLVDYSDDPESLDQPLVLEGEVPADLRCSQFFDSLIGRVLNIAPVEMHVAVRENHEGHELPLSEMQGSE
ncbi:MAG TPA: hypothetical protein VHX87_07900 [Galbitalea sp.]|nr:hypothetical protein [Galbitalea sp.]